ncbi:ImmA/IrrE family metallo-endopeptidase [Alicyclobacillus acidoterrestris]|uniref:ImmA/IrrE family metallo-endopeptidase n=1 Tax=Alicyclobacillus acidoterrestris TaxID=1450 RepID=UPI003F538BDB
MEIEKLITAYYRAHNVRYPHEIQLDLFAERLGITVLRLPRPALCGSKRIVIDCRQPPEMQREQLAHELGHRILHSGRQPDMDPLFRGLQEEQTRLFAMYALVPTFMLAPLVSDTPQYYEHQCAYLASIFCVAYKFMRQRLNLFESTHLVRCR